MKWPTIIRVINAVMLFAAIPPIWPYGYYTLLRLVTTAVCCLLAYVSLKLKKQIVFAVFVLMALLFNPLIIVHLDKIIWSVIDLVTGLFLLLSIYLSQSQSLLKLRYDSVV